MTRRPQPFIKEAPNDWITTRGDSVALLFKWKGPERTSQPTRPRMSAAFNVKTPRFSHQLAADSN